MSPCTMLTFLPWAVPYKTSWNCMRVSLQLSPGAFCCDFHMRVIHMGRTPCFSDPSFRRGIWRASNRYAEVGFSFQNRAPVESSCLTWRTAASEVLWLWNGAFNLTTSEIQKTLRWDLVMQTAWLFMTKAKRKVPMAFKRRLKGVLELKKLLQKRAKHFFNSCCSQCFTAGGMYSPELPCDPESLFCCLCGWTLCPRFYAFSCSGPAGAENGCHSGPQCHRLPLREHTGCVSCSHCPSSNPDISEASKEMCVGLMYSFLLLGLAQRLKLGTYISLVFLLHWIQIITLQQRHSM